MKATDGLSDLAKQVLELAGDQLSGKTRKQLLELRSPLIGDDFLALYQKARADLIAKEKLVPMLEAARIRWLKKLLKKNFGEM